MEFSITFSETGLASISKQLRELRSQTRWFGSIPGLGSATQRMVQGISTIGGMFQLAAGTVASGVAVKFAEDFFKHVLSQRQRTSTVAGLIGALYARAFGVNISLAKAYQWSAVVWRRSVRRLERVVDVLQSAVPNLSIRGLQATSKTLSRWTQHLVPARLRQTIAPVVLWRGLEQRVRAVWNHLTQALGTATAAALSLLSTAIAQSLAFSAQALSRVSGLLPHILKKPLSSLASHIASLTLVFASFSPRLARMGSLIASSVTSLVVRVAALLGGTLVAVGAVATGLTVLAALAHRGLQEFVGRITVSALNVAQRAWSAAITGISQVWGAFRLGLARLTGVWQFAAEHQLIRVDELDRRISPAQVEEYRLLETVDARVQQHWNKLAEQLEVIIKRVDMKFREQNLSIYKALEAQQRRERAIYGG